MLHRATFLLCLITGAICTENTSSPRIVIVGAGASGIAAAAKLLENGFQNVLILEAEDRIGGRVNTVQFGKFTAQLTRPDQVQLEARALVDESLLSQPTIRSI